SKKDKDPKSDKLISHGDYLNRLNRVTTCGDAYWDTKAKSLKSSIGKLHNLKLQAKDDDNRRSAVAKLAQIEFKLKRLTPSRVTKCLKRRR
ncbi:MAG: hypothetical protein AAGC55_32955, partial [Myxococcota bacterium]